MTVLVPAAGSLLPPGAAPAASRPDRPEDADGGSAAEQPGHPWAGAPRPTQIDPASAGPVPIEPSRAALPLPYPDVTPASPADLPAPAYLYRPADPLFGPSGAEYGPAAVPPAAPLYPAAAPVGPELPPLPSSTNPAAPWQVPEESPSAPGVPDPPPPATATAESAPLHRGEMSRFDVTRPGAALMPAQPPQVQPPQVQPPQAQTSQGQTSQGHTPDPTRTGLFPPTGGATPTRDATRSDDIAGFGDGAAADPAAGASWRAAEASAAAGPWAEPISTAPALPPPPPNMPVRRVPAAPVRPAGAVIAPRAAGAVPQPAPATAASAAPVGADGLVYQRPRAGGRRVLIGGFGGGGGRTTVAAGLGLAMAAHHGHRVVAVDASPDQCGLLAHRVGLMPPGVGLRELAGARPPVSSLEDVRRFLASDGSGGLEVLAGMRDLAGPGLLPEELAWALDLLGHWYPAVVADAPPGWNQPVPATLLARADLLVLTVRAGEAEIAGADDALTALTAAGRGDLVATVIVAIVETYPSRLSRGARMRLDHLEDRAYMTVPVPFDAALADSRPINWFRLRRRTRFAFQRLAGAVATAPLPGSQPAAALARPALAAADPQARIAAWPSGA
ncbi:ATPase involved in chromosome partitioning [Frankia torreyi]|uniref:ATPase involved in chromosome partitioning n=3 Tax=Frankia TaxID=1854 RepID=A0A0D8BAP5_9ACTN|nr:ATPase involved in chromosome partitioning [Frankia torreyi]KQM03396.1 ATPase involved in chromosome partitioning [Frankia sp. CpI1-P]